MSSASPIKKVILFLGQPDGEKNQIKKEWGDSLDSKTTPLFVIAKDGPDATSKAANQKFDAVVVDMKLPRLQESLFLESIQKNQNVAKAEVIAIVPQAGFILPQTLENAGQVITKPYTPDILIRALAKSLAAIQAGSQETVKGRPNCDYAVDVRILNALVKATTFICQQFGVTNVQLKKPEIKPVDKPWYGDIGACIGIQSRVFQGAMIISFEQAVFLKIMSEMLGETQSLINDENKDAIGEISNMILGNAKSDFTQYDVGMTIPTILSKGANPSCPAGAAALLIPAETPFGMVYIEVIAHKVGK